MQVTTSLQRGTLLASKSYPVLFLLVVSFLCTYSATITLFPSSKQSIDANLRISLRKWIVRRAWAKEAGVGSETMSTWCYEWQVV
ncbi:hypothetical protein BDV35DRAFT_228968 [Aspergillus flavus]|uniref:Uncharacterized protein n=1 Tax=Aspergillus flavus TaxID=5059 RepID=A0A5N6GX70_ASPFL|nr:hypothetical protein BDV35DRAFT_228968 [Aspergillus flavus]